MIKVNEDYFDLLMEVREHVLRAHGPNPDRLHHLEAVELALRIEQLEHMAAKGDIPLTVSESVAVAPIDVVKTDFLTRDQGVNEEPLGVRLDHTPTDVYVAVSKHPQYLANHREAWTRLIAAVNEAQERDDEG